MNDDSQQGSGAFDADTLAARYREERDKRVRGDGTGQYVAPSGELARYLADPYVEDGAPRDPVERTVEVAILGCGFGGLIAAAQLAKLGITDIAMLDKASDFGGVWYWNRYPGAACDVESYIYLPLLEETGYIPTERYARGPEIFEYARLIARKYDLYQRAVFRSEVQEMRFDETTGLWSVTTHQGDRITARYVLLSTGQLHSLHLPGIPGIEQFAGESFHSSRWNYAFTGGDSNGGLTKLADKKVGLIGTGASGVQCVPYLAESAAHLYVFQRTPASVPPRNNSPTDPDWFRSMPSGWQQRRLENFTRVTSGAAVEQDLINDGWTEIRGRVGVNSDPTDTERRDVDFAFMEGVRSRVDALVEDSHTAAALKPWYNANCKRPCFHDFYLSAFNRPNVTLVDTDGQGVEKIEGNVVWAGGKPYQIDCLIYASGFDFQSRTLAERNGFEIYGRGGHSLTDKCQPEMKTLFGMFHRGFPNLFIQSGAQASLTVNITHILTESANVFAKLIKQCRDRGAISFEVTAQAEQGWVDRMRSYPLDRLKFDQECTPSYLNNEGNPHEGAAILAFYPGGAVEYIDIIRAWIADGDLAGLELRKDAAD